MPHAGRVNILLVDDQPANLLALEAVLGEQGRNLVRAASGEEALRHVLETDFAAILLDVRMPTLSGFETAKLIRARPRSRATPIIFLTAADGDGFSAEQAYALGAVDYLTRPLIPLILQAKVAVFVELYQKTEALKAAERERARVILESITDAFYALDREWRFTYVNQRAAKYFGTHAEELLGRVAWDALSAGRDPVFKDEYLRAAREQRTAAFETRSPLTGRWVEVRAYPSADGLAVYFRDVTARKQAEEAAAEEARRKDEFLATLAHELRNPLSPILNGLCLLKLSPTGAAAERARGMVERQVGHMVRLIDDLLDVSRVSRGRLELRRQRVTVRTVLDGALETSGPLVEAAGHELVVRLPDEPLHLHADPVRLAQVVSNLLNNAAKYTPAGGRIELSAERDGGEAVVRVTDTGVGIEAGQLAEVFEMFNQVGRTIDRAQGGLGIGLALVKNLVQMHGGTVTAESRGPGLGSTFTVRLPFA